MSSEPSEVQLQEGTEQYNTPLHWVDPIARILGGFDLDPCASRDSHLANNNIRECGGLKADWSNYDNIWVNHPYGRGEPEQWLRKAATSEAKTVVTLSKADPSTTWFDRFIWQEADLICFPSSNRDGGRIQFVGGQSTAVFPNVFAVFGEYPPALSAHFERIGPTCQEGYRH